MVGMKKLEDQPGHSQSLSAVRHAAELNFCFGFFWLCCLFACKDYHIPCLYCTTDNKSKQPRPKFFKRFPEGNVNYLSLPAPPMSSGTYKSQFYFEKCSHLL